MECNWIREHAADWLEGRLRDEEKERFGRHLDECVSCREELVEMRDIWEKMDAVLDEEPGPDLERRFNFMLDTYKNARNDIHVRDTGVRRHAAFPGIWRPVMQAAAAMVLVALGVLWGRGMEHGKLRDMEVASLRQELSQMREMVTISLMTQSSAIDRLQGVTMSRDVAVPDDRLLDTLIAILDADPNVNVRMAAVDALGKYRDRDRVQKALVEALGRQDSPLVQVSLIELLVDMRAPGAKSALRSLIESKDSLEPVKKRARAGLEKII